jgi:pimeloyl-ACP methyl ester carboxylesterase
MQQRTRSSSSLAVVRAGFRAVSRTSPGLAARIGEKLMFRTTRRQAAAWEQQLLERGRRFSIASPWGELAAWSWGEGPTVLLVHGWNGRGSQLGRLVAPLVSAGYRVVTFDAPGHGQSPGSSSSMLHFADAIEHAVDSLRPVFGTLAAIIAHSMGGPAVVVAMSRFQKRSTTERERSLRDALPVERFVFVAPPIDVRDFVRGFSRQVELGSESEALLGQLIETRFATPLASLHAPTLARSLSAPLLVIHDADDREVPLRQGERLAEAWRSARLWVTSGLGHTRILTDPEVVYEIAGFVAAPERSAA